MKHLIIILLSIIFFVNLPAQDNRLEIIQKDIQDIENIRKATKDLHNSLMAVKGQIDELAAKAQSHQINNMMKTYIKGLMDLYDLIKSPPTSAFDYLKGAIENLVVQPYFTKARTDTINIEDLKIRQTAYTAKLNYMYNTVGQVMSASLTDFDDDKTPFAFCDEYWKTPDGRTDDETELLTRKLKVITGLCTDLSDELDSSCEKLREDFVSWSRLLDQDKNLLPRLKREAEINQQIRERHQKRMKEFEEAEKITEELRKEEEKRQALSENEKYALRKKEQELEMSRGYEYRGFAEAERKRKANEYKEQMAALELGKTASISYELKSEYPIYANYHSVNLKAFIIPEGAAGDIIWEVDDFVVGQQEVSRHNPETPFNISFKNTGIHDVSVSLFVNGVFVDKHLSQITVEEDPIKTTSYKRSLLLNNFGSPPYHSVVKSLSKRNGRMQIVDLPYSKYWVSGLEGQEIIDGHYFNMSGQKKEYKSLKIMDYNSSNPLYGFFALTSFNGYHVYRTMENNIPCLIVTLLSANGPEEKENISNVLEFEVIIAQNYSKADIKYKTKTGDLKTITLR